jgi:hypothetical protein
LNLIRRRSVQDQENRDLNSAWWPVTPLPDLLITVANGLKTC